MTHHKLIQGDCLKAMKDIPDNSIDLILCDLPYGTTACSWDSVIPFEPLWEQYKRIAKDNTAIVLTGSQPFTSALIMSNIEMFKYEWIWEKQKASNFMSMKYQPAKYHENIIVFCKSKTQYNPINWVIERNKRDKRNIISDPRTNKSCHLGDVVRERKKDDGTRSPKSIIKIDKEINTNIHPTQKPVALFEYLIKTYSNEGGLVLDNCAGSGTTMQACVNTKRNSINIEISEKYCDIIKERCFGQQSLFEKNTFESEVFEGVK